MPTLKVRFDYLTLIHSSTGLVALLPSPGHDASLEYSGFATRLRSASVTLLRDGAIATGSKPLQATDTPGYLFLKDIMIFSDMPANAGAAPKAKYLRESVANLPELNARVILPDGTITPRTTKTTAPMYEFRKTVLGVESTMALGFESLEYETSLDKNSKYQLHIEQPGCLPVVIDVTSGGTVVIANADRESSNTKPMPWFELGYLLNLLELQPMDFLLPVLQAKFISCPNNEPCEPVVSGSVTLLAKAGKS